MIGITSMFFMQFMNSHEADIAARIVWACIQIVLCIVLVYFVTRLLTRVLSRDSVPIPSSSIFVAIIKVVLWLGCVCSILSSCFGFDLSAAFAALGVGGIALSLGAKDTIANVIGGIQVSVLGLVVPGEYIRVGESCGQVQDVTWRQTVVKSLDGTLYYIPNAQINSSTLVKVINPSVVKVPLVLTKLPTSVSQLATHLEKCAYDAAQQEGTVREKPVCIFKELSEYGARGLVQFEMADEVEALRACDSVVRALADAVQH